MKYPLVVGYRGEIGRFILSGLLEYVPKALDIHCFDVNESEKEKLERIEKSDVIFLCVPVRNTVEWLLQYKPYLENKTIIEQSSIKLPLYCEKKILDLNLLSMHLLFRPSATPDPKDRRAIIFQQVNAGSGVFQVNRFDNLKFLQDLVRLAFKAQVKIVDSSKDHDHSMAFSQALVHRVLLSLDKTLRNYPDTYLSAKVKELVRRIKAGDSDLYSFIQSNKYAVIAKSAFVKEFECEDLVY